jgi:hypothetical protein
MANARTHESSQPEARIEINLGRLQQLFNSLDPSPFHDRDLDHDAEEYIVGWAEEIALQRPLSLVIHLPQDQLAGVEQPVLESAIHNYFSYQHQQCQRRLRILFRDGRMALSVGFAFLFVCILIRQLAHSMGPGPASEIVAEGMLIAGWVAMWRPLDIFLYDWWPIRRRSRVLGKLSAMPVIVRSR